MADLKKELTQLKKDLKILAAKIAKLEKAGSQKPKRANKAIAARKSKTQKSAVGKAAGKKAPKKSSAKRATAKTDYSSVIDFIKRSKNGISALELKKKTGFNDKKIANIIYKAKKKGDIKSPKKGIYTT